MSSAWRHAEWPCVAAIIQFNRRLPPNHQAALLAFHHRPSLNLIEFPDRHPTLMFIRAVLQDKEPLSASQTCPINLMGAKWLNAAVLHRLSPFRAMRLDELIEFVPNDEMAGFVNHRFHSILF